MTAHASSALHGQVALVTGGGSGIGLACATHLARDGATVVLAGRNPDKLSVAAAGLEADGLAVRTVVSDVTDEAAVQAACDLAAEVGRFTMVVANAGMGAAGPLHLTTLDDWNAVLGTNVSVGIRANAVRPGLVPTDISVGLTSTDTIVADYIDQMPIGRLGTTDDIAASVRFLLGPESGWITGQCLSVDGGHTLRRGPNLTPLMEMVMGAAAHPGAPT